MVETSHMILLAFLLDMILGDPRWIPHPVRWIGILIEKMEKKLRDTFLPEETSGWILALTVIFSTLFCSSYALSFAGKFSPFLGSGLEIWMIFTAISLRCLREEAMKIKRLISENSLSEARRSLSMIVGRDTENMPEREVVRSTVETVAENFVDGIVSPLFFAWIGGGPLALTYKAINTLDSMVGYKNKRYIRMGRASAIIDDTANYIPARIAIPLISAGAFFCRYDYRNAFTIGWRDRKKHPSPNAAHPEAAMAGALGIQLGGASRYQGKISKKPLLGDNRTPLEKDHIQQGLRLIKTATFVFVVLILLLPTF